MNPDPFARLRAVLAPYIEVEPSDEQLWRLVYLLDLAAHAPVDLTHGADHGELKAWVSKGLELLPRVIKKAETEAAAARKHGRTTGLDQQLDEDSDRQRAKREEPSLAWRLRAALAAIEPLRPATARRDSRSAWHGWARLAAPYVAAIVAQCGGGTVTFKHGTASGVPIMMALFGKSEDQIIEALRERK